MLHLLETNARSIHDNLVAMWPNYRHVNKREGKKRKTLVQESPPWEYCRRKRQKESRRKGSEGISRSHSHSGDSQEQVSYVNGSILDRVSSSEHQQG